MTLNLKNTILNFYSCLVVAGSTLPLVGMAQQTDYPVNFPIEQTHTYNNRRLTGVEFTSSYGVQRLDFGTPATTFVDRTDQMVVARAGDEITSRFNFTTDWMHGYVYLDRGQDGQFSSEANNGVIAEGSDLMAFSYYKDFNSTATAQSNSNTMLVPSFRIPADLNPGIYRLRFKVDWNSIDPAGALSPDDNTPTGNNGIVRNGGAIIDVCLNISANEVNLQTPEEGTVLGEDGEHLAKLSFGTAKTLKIVVPEGKQLSEVRVRTGYHLEGERLIHSTPQWKEISYPGYVVNPDSFVLSAEMTRGDIRITPIFVDAQTIAPNATPYPLNFEASHEHKENANNVLSAVRFTDTRGGTTEMLIAAADQKRIYQDISQRYNLQVSALPGETIAIRPTFSGDAMHAYLYLDLNNDGQFTPNLNTDGTPTAIGELVAYNYYQGRNERGEIVEANQQPATLTSFTVPAQLPTGVYRGRYKIDRNSIDPAGRYSDTTDTENIDIAGGYIVDFLLNVHGATSTLDIITEHGNVYANMGALPEQVPAFQRLPIVTRAVAPGYELAEMTIKHGHHLDGPQYVHGNRQWEIVERTAGGSYTLPRELTDANILITAKYKPTASAKFLPVFVEEFTGEDYSQPNAEIWKRTERQNATWNRWCSDAEEVVYIKNNALVCHALPTPARLTHEKAPMITGGVKSQGNFGFRYGKVEARLRTHRHVGNFPAIWMMPVDNSKGWPNAGEIDIWEQIDTENTSVHTIHSKWTYTLGNKNNPQSSFSKGGVDMERYHTYGIEWTPTVITWFVDGAKVGEYRKSTNAQDLANGQWPFDAPFYLILNQSVGNGVWAKNPDLKHTYTTIFDWVRVYQTVEQNPSLTGVETLVREEDSASSTYYDLSGRRVGNPRSGLYIVRGKKVMLP